MAQRTAALPAQVNEIAIAFGVNFLMGPNAFDECLYEIAWALADDATRKRSGTRAVFKAALSGVAAGLAIGKHIERQRLRQNTTKEEST